MKSIETGSSPDQIKSNNESTQESSAELKPEGALEQEKSILGKFRGKAKEVAGALFLATALVTGAGAVEQAFAEEKPTAENAEKKKTPQERAVDLLGALSNLPNNPSALNEAQNKQMKSQVARQLIFKFALEKKLGFPEAGKIAGRISPEDIRNALKDLGVAGEAFADMQFGDKDGKASPEEMEKFKEAVKTNPGLRTLQEMLQQFLSQ